MCFSRLIWILVLFLVTIFDPTVPSNPMMTRRFLLPLESIGSPLNVTRRPMISSLVSRSGTPAVTLPLTFSQSIKVTLGKKASSWVDVEKETTD